MENTLVLAHADDIQAIVYPRFADLEYPNPEAEEFTLELDFLDDELQEDKLWKARTGLNEDTLCGAIETLVFMSDRPIALAKIRTAIDPDLPLRIVHSAIERLQEGYEQTLHGIRLVEVAEGYQFRTKATYSRFVQDLFKVNSLVLSPTALEVLAIIAYKQPVARTEVDKIRGVDSSHIVRGLMDKRLVRVTGRSEEMGRPVLYGTTPEFLEVFNLATTADLPPEHELDELATQSLGKISDISGLVDGDKKRFMFDEIGELDELSESIKSISADTEFTSSLKLEDKRRTSSEGEPVKTAFELLEEFVHRNQVVDQNTKAILSVLPTAFSEPKVISDLEGGPYNTPEEEDDSFEMIDLETGEPIRDSEVAPEMVQEGAMSALFDEEARALGEALDEAFDRLTSQRLDDNDNELNELSDEVEELENQLEGVTTGIRSLGEDLDLDLSFLDEDKNSPDINL
jgi:segregation and condensation protein B